MFEVHNPEELGRPLSAYSHVVDVPAGSRTVFLSGQTPLLPDGSVPSDMEAQAELVWHRIGIALAAAGMDFQNVCRVVTYLTDAGDAAAHARVRARYLGAARPASTGLVVKALFNPAYRLEVEVTAAGSARSQPVVAPAAA